MKTSKRTRFTKTHLATKPFDKSMYTKTMCGYTSFTVPYPEFLKSEDKCIKCDNILYKDFYKSTL